MDKQAVRHTVEQLAAFLELQGEGTFRVRAFQNAVGIARKGGLEPSHVVNTRPADEFLAFTRRRRTGPR